MNPFDLTRQFLCRFLHCKCSTKCLFIHKNMNLKWKQTIKLCILQENRTIYCYYTLESVNEFWLWNQYFPQLYLSHAISIQLLKAQLLLDVISISTVTHNFRFDLNNKVYLLPNQQWYIRWILKQKNYNMLLFRKYESVWNAAGNMRREIYTIKRVFMIDHNYS
jgi:hypothetical protein